MFTTNSTLLRALLGSEVPGHGEAQLGPSEYMYMCLWVLRRYLFSPRSLGSFPLVVDSVVGEADILSLAPANRRSLLH